MLAPPEAAAAAVLVALPLVVPARPARRWRVARPLPPRRRPSRHARHEAGGLDDCRRGPTSVVQVQPPGPPPDTDGPSDQAVFASRTLHNGFPCQGIWTLYAFKPQVTSPESNSEASYDTCICPHYSLYHATGAQEWKATAPEHASIYLAITFAKNAKQELEYPQL
eukprot:SM000142S00533  [mRNA]  locus=s142:180935:181827:- [translate_table: standard]